MTRHHRAELDRITEDSGRHRTALPLCAGTWKQEAIKEQVADALLRSAPRSEEYPAYTECHLARRQLERCIASVEKHTEILFATHPSQDMIDELSFLMALTPLERRERFFLRGWALGWKQHEIGTRWVERFGKGRQQVCRVVQGALRKCYASTGVNFEAFSRHSLYRPPCRRRATWHMRPCGFCQEPFIRGMGAGLFCSVGCRNAAHHRSAT